MNACPSCGEPGGAHAPDCALARYESGPITPGRKAPEPDPVVVSLDHLRTEVRALRRLVAFLVVLLVLWALVWAVLQG